MGTVHTSRRFGRSFSHLDGTVTGEAESPSLARRQRELASLYATAKSLTALGDVLQAIVHNAHDLIGTDFTYLSLVDANGRRATKP